MLNIFRLPIFRAAGKSILSAAADESQFQKDAHFPLGAKSRDSCGSTLDPNATREYRKHLAAGEL
jgi:hypothetical protein